MRKRKTSIRVAGLLLSGIAGAGCSTTPHHQNETDRIEVPRMTERQIDTVSEKSNQSVRQVGEIETLPSIQGTPIDLAEALRIAGTENPTVNLAIEAAREAEARAEAADALKWPSLNAGFNFHIHRGNLQRSPGTILAVNSQSLYFGAGARSLAAETVAFPGIRAFYPFADVVIEPQAAQQKLVTRRSESTGIRNATLLEVATAYMDLQAASVTVAELTRSESDLAEITRVTEAYAKTGQGRESDARRASANRALLQKQLEEAVGEQQIASARLSRLLNLDPSTLLRTTSSTLVPLNIVEDKADLETLVNRAETARPELTARSGEINEARLRVRQEQIRPWLPTLIAGYSIGGFGGGSNLTTSEFGRFDSRSDFDVSAVWSIQNLGFGNRANINRTTAMEMQAIANLTATRNQVREEVTTAQANVVATRSRIETARKRIAAAEEGYSEELKRVKQAQGLPLELIDSAKSLSEARLDLAKAISAYNIAQFQLLTAIGTSPEASTTGEQ